MLFAVNFTKSCSKAYCSYQLSERLVNFCSITQVSTIKPVGVHGDFWEQNFNEDEVAWYKFQQAFVADFKENIDSLYDDAKATWLLNMLKIEVFEAEHTDKVTKKKYEEVRGHSKEKHHFWKVINDRATLKQSLKDILVMESPVRLVAVENLG